MSAIKFYTIEDWVQAYLKEWGYNNPALTARLSGELKKENKTLRPEDVIAVLNQKVMRRIENYLPGDGFGDLQKLNYFKMIFLSEGLAARFALFEEPTPEEYAVLAPRFHRFLAAPDLILSDMQRQSIKTYHPFWRIRKTFAKGVKAVVHSVKKK